MVGSCTHSAGATLPGGLVPQPLEPVVKESSEGTPLQQSHPGVVVVVTELVVVVVAAALVVVVAAAEVVVVAAPVVVVVAAPVVVVVPGGQGFGEQVPAPTLIPFCAAHCAAVSSVQVSKAPPADDCTQHWIGGGHGLGEQVPDPSAMPP